MWILVSCAPSGTKCGAGNDVTLMDLVGTFLESIWMTVSSLNRSFHVTQGPPGVSLTITSSLSCRRQSHLNAKPFISKMSSLLVVKATFIVSPSLFPPQIKKNSFQSRPSTKTVCSLPLLFGRRLPSPHACLPPRTPSPHTHITHHTCSVKPICPRSKPDVDP